MADPNLDLVGQIRSRHAAVLAVIAEAAHRGGRSPEAVRLVVVTKSQPLRVVEAAIDAGVRRLGENYAEEAVSKINAIQTRTMGSPVPSRIGRATGEMPAGVEWHMIGHIQSRKAKLVAEYFDLIHSLDSVKLAQRLDRLAAELGRELQVLLELNVGGEAAKHGWGASDQGAWPQLLEDMQAIAGLSNIKIRGLMTMPPLAENPEDARVFFRRLRDLRDFLNARTAGAEWSELSMGTSADFAVAVEEGATLVRVGEAIVGPRPVRELT
jgi:pyridoxal phosphate enzyme (YggS family)